MAQPIPFPTINSFSLFLHLLILLAVKFGKWAKVMRYTFKNR